MATVGRRIIDSNPRGAVSRSYSGDEGFRRGEQERERMKQLREERQKQGGRIFRFRVPQGETREMIIVDEGAPTFFRFEHALVNPESGYRDRFTGCVQESDVCPICQTGDRAAYCMYLTCIDLTPYTTKNGEEIPFSKQLLVVKSAQQQRFARLLKRYDGSLRGLLLRCTRDGAKDPVIGNDIEDVEQLPEEELQQYVRTWTDRENKRHTDVCHEPYDYEKLFPLQNAVELRAIVGGSPVPGSAEHNDRYTDRSAAPSRGQPGRVGVPAGRSALRPMPSKAAEEFEEPDAATPWDEADVEAEEVRPTKPAPVARRALRTRPEPTEQAELDETAEPDGNTLEEEQPLPVRGAVRRPAPSVAPTKPVTPTHRPMIRRPQR